MTHIIYGLVDPNTKELRYIGYSSDIIQRMKVHYSQSELKFATHKNHWLKKLLVAEQKAEVIVLEEYTTSDELPQAEIEVIAYYKFIGCNLTNGTSGGDGFIKGHKKSEITKQRISLSSSGKPKSDEHKKAMSLAAKNRWNKNRGVEV